MVDRSMNRVKSSNHSAEEEDATLNNDSERSESYRDYSEVPPPRTNPRLAPSATKEPTFPVKLHMILSNPEFEDIISWLPHGRSWRILQQKAFEERVIPLYFRHGRYSSFARQVNGWGYRRVTHGSDYNSYYHELFLRGLPHLCDKMRRLTSKDAAHKKALEEEVAPDFYAISKEHPLPESNESGPGVASGRGAASVPKSRLDAADEAADVPTSPLSRSVSLGSQNQVPALQQQQHHSSSLPPDVELALLERRRAEILNRINSLSVARTMNPVGLGPAATGLSGLGVAGYPEVPPASSLMGMGGLGLLPPSYLLGGGAGSLLGGFGALQATNAASTQAELDLLLQRREARLLGAPGLADSDVSADTKNLYARLGGGSPSPPPSSLVRRYHEGGL